jgi:hypothetical protein
VYKGLVVGVEKMGVRNVDSSRRIEYPMFMRKLRTAMEAVEKGGYVSFIRLKIIEDRIGFIHSIIPLDSRRLKRFNGWVDF